MTPPNSPSPSTPAPQQPPHTDPDLRRAAAGSKTRIAAVGAIVATLVLITAASIILAVQAQHAAAQAQLAAAAAQANEASANARAERALANAEDSRREAALAQASEQREREQRMLVEDAEAFEACCSFNSGTSAVNVRRPLTLGAIRHISRQPTWTEMMTNGGGFEMDAAIALMVEERVALGRMQVLDLTSSGVTDEGLRALARAGAQLTSLQSLNLRNTDVTDQGLAHLAAEDSSLTALR